jgi:hypothetical protein
MPEPPDDGPFSDGAVSLSYPVIEMSLRNRDVLNAIETSLQIRRHKTEKLKKLFPFEISLFRQRYLYFVKDILISSEISLFRFRKITNSKYTFLRRKYTVPFRV